MKKRDFIITPSISIILAMVFVISCSGDDGNYQYKIEMTPYIRR